MKKGLRWIISGLVLASTFTVAACGGEEVEEHKHTYAATWTSNEAGHWYAATCEHTDQMANMATHEDEDNDGVCDVCEYGSDHVHTYEEAWTSDETNHWYAVSCGHSVEVKDKAAHVDEGNDGACDVCGFDNGHIHTWNKAEWTNDTAYHWHSVTCGHTIDVADKAAHTDANDDGICEICEGQTFEAGHTHMYDETKWENNTTHHWYASTCHTGLKKNETKHTDNNKDGVCDVCEGKTYDEADHTHTYASTWSINDTHHWQEGNCGHPGLKNNYAEHKDTNNDGACDTCGRTDHTHTYSSAWTTDENKHWHDASCGCALKVLEENHVDKNDDGVCDVCEYEDTTHVHNMVQKFDDDNHWMECDAHTGVVSNVEAHIDVDANGICDVCERADYDNTHTHTYADTYSYDMNNHWFAGNCGHAGLMDSVAAHVDLTTPAAEGEGTVEVADGYCDVCGMETFASIVARVSTEETQAIVKKGFVSVNNYASEEFYFEYGVSDYFHVLGMASDGFEYWYMKEGSGIFALYDTGNGKLSVPYSATVDNLKGYAIELSYNEVGYGVSDAIALFYEVAAASENFEVAFVGDVYSFTGTNANGQAFTVSFTLDEARVGYTPDWDPIYATFVSWFKLAIDDYYDTTYEIEQFVGTRTAVSPYKADDFLADSFDLEIHMFEYIDYSDVEGDAIEFTNTLTIAKGNGANLYIKNVLPTTANFTFDSFTFTVNGEEESDVMQINDNTGDDEPYIQIRTTSSTPAGTYTVVISSLRVSYEFTVNVTLPAVTSINPMIDGSVTDAVSIYTGDLLSIRSKVNANANPAYTASITSENAANATITKVDVEATDWVPAYTKYEFTTTVAGTYVVTLVSAENSEITATLTITVTAPPQISDIINGSFIVDNSDYWNTNTLYVTFTPASEGAVTGTAAVTIINANGVTTYNVNYAYDETNGIVLTNTDGSAFTAASLFIEDYALNASWTGLANDWYSGGMTETICGGVAVESAPYTPPTLADQIAGEYRYYINLNNPRYVLELNADGTGAFTSATYNSASRKWNTVESATFNWTVEDSNGSYVITISDVTGSTMLTAGAYTMGKVVDNNGMDTTGICGVSMTIDSAATTLDYYCYELYN